MRRAGAIARVAIALIAGVAGLGAPARAQVAIDDSLVVPFVTETGQRGSASFRLAPEPKAFMVSPSGIAVWRQEETLELARERALSICARVARIACRPFAENDRLVWDGPLDIDAQLAFARTHNEAVRVPASRGPAEVSERNVAPIEDPARAPLYGPTPATLPGGKVIATAALRDLLAREQPPVLVDVSSSPRRAHRHGSRRGVDRQGGHRCLERGRRLGRGARLSRRDGPGRPRSRAAGDL